MHRDIWKWDDWLQEKQKKKVTISWSQAWNVAESWLVNSSVRLLLFMLLRWQCIQYFSPFWSTPEKFDYEFDQKMLANPKVKVTRWKSDGAAHIITRVLLNTYAARLLFPFGTTAPPLAWAPPAPMARSDSAKSNNKQKMGQKPEVKNPIGGAPPCNQRQSSVWHRQKKRRILQKEFIAAFHL